MAQTALVVPAGREQRSDPPKVAPTAIVTLSAVGILVALVLGLGAMMVMRDYEDTTERAELTASHAAQTTAEHIRWIVQASLVVLDRVDRLIEDAPTVFLRTEIGQIDQALAALPGDPVVWVANERGRTVLSTDLGRTPLDVSPHDYFAQIRDGTPWLVSHFLPEGASGQPVFKIVRRVVRAGEFRGLIGLTIQASQLSAFSQSLNLSDEATIAVVRTDGWLVARHPIPEANVNFLDRPLFTEQIANNPSGVYRGNSPLDDLDRIIAYTPIPDAPLYAVASVSAEVALKRFWDRLTLLLALGGPVVVGLVALTIWIGGLLLRDQARRRELQSALSRNETLLAEVHHRVKNNLQLISSLINLQPWPDDGKRELIRRVGAVSALHQQLYQSSDFGKVDLEGYLQDAVAALESSYQSDATIQLTIDSLKVDANKALPIALIATEVISNSLKHAFTPQMRGKVMLECHVEDDSLALRIGDTGRGFKSGAADQGFGMTLIEALTRQIGGVYSLEGKDGTHFTMHIPLANLISDFEAAASPARAPV